ELLITGQERVVDRAVDDQRHDVVGHLHVEELGVDALGDGDLALAGAPRRRRRHEEDQKRRERADHAGHRASFIWLDGAVEALILCPGEEGCQLAPRAMLRAWLVNDVRHPRWAPRCAGSSASPLTRTTSNSRCPAASPGGRVRAAT